MKSFRSVLLAAGLTLVLATAARAVEIEPGYVDIGQLMPAPNGKFVEINLSPGLLRFAAKIAAHQEPEAADLLANLKRIRVNVVTMDDSNRASLTEKIASVRHKLETQGWTQMVTVREKDDGDNVDIHVKQHGEDAIDGLVVTVIDHKGEAVFINIVGNISADQIAKIADKFNIEPLRQVRLKMEHKQHQIEQEKEKDV